MSDKRSCYNCQHYSLCFLRRNVDKAIQEGIGILNIDGKGAPGRMTEIFDSVGRACMQFEPNEGDE